jgi:hypothetical protein
MKIERDITLKNSEHQSNKPTEEDLDELEHRLKCESRREDKTLI